MEKGRREEGAGNKAAPSRNSILLNGKICKYHAEALLSIGPEAVHHLYSQTVERPLPTPVSFTLCRERVSIARKPELPVLGQCKLPLQRSDVLINVSLA